MAGAARLTSMVAGKASMEIAYIVQGAAEVHRSPNVGVPVRVRPFEGTRYSLVFYTCDRFQQAAGQASCCGETCSDAKLTVGLCEASQGVRSAMCSAGFTFKWSSMRLQETGLAGTIGILQTA